MKEFWRKPELNVTGQSAFWDAQATVYESADMTVDNRQEIEFVINQCREIDCGEIVTLGGAVGCRDPKMILEEVFLRERNSRKLPKVIFNDLSTQQVEWAKEKVLRKYAEIGTEIAYLPGEIKTVCRTIDNRTPKRLLIGVYNCQSFFEAHPSDGYPMCGFDEYIKNCRILGHEFLMEWVRYLPGGNLIPTRVRSLVSSSDDIDTQSNVKKALQIFHKSACSDDFKDVIGLQIVGRSKGRDGFFLSHWYTPAGFKRMLGEVFPATSFSVTESLVAKGMVYAIDPIGHKPRGVVTVLNNVIGNVLPHSQFETLMAIRGIIS